VGRADHAAGAPVSLLLVLLGGALGAPARYLISRHIAARSLGTFPWGTMVVNVAGSALLGAVLAATTLRGAPEWLATFIGAGFCGALTTYSTFAYETLLLSERVAIRAAVRNVLLSVALGLAAGVLGWLTVAALP